MFGNLAFLLENTKAAASLGSLDAAAAPVTELVDKLYPPLIAIVSSVAVIYCIFLGAKLAKADEPQEREKAKGALKNAIIGYLLIFVLILVLKQVSPVLADWVNPTSSTTTTTTTTTN